MKLIQIYDKMDRHGGAQSVLMQLNRYFQSKFSSAYVCSHVSYEIFYYKNNLSKNKYIKFTMKNIFLFKGATVVSHSRKTTTYLILLNKLFFLKMNIVHVAHSIFKNKKYTTLYPKNIIAVSHAVKKNLIEYFGVKEQNIAVIYNGITDAKIDNPTLEYDKNHIKIVLIGRVEVVKQQLKIVQNLNGKISKNIHVDFVGDGSQVEELQNLIKKSNSNFCYVGFNNDIPKLLENYHYVMLFSEKEGLGLSLIEGCMMKKPLISRGTGGCEACSEVCIDEYNGFVVNTFDELIKRLNTLQNISKEKYEAMCINARNHFEEFFREDSMVEKYVSYIFKLKEGK